MSYPFVNLEAEPFEAYTRYDDESESFDTESFEESEAEWEGEWLGEINRGAAAYIGWLQQSLNKVLGLRLATDGRMGTQTRSALRSFQQRAGLRADGDPGPQTEAALVRAGATPPPGGEAGGAGADLVSSIGGGIKSAFDTASSAISSLFPASAPATAAPAAGVVSTPCGVSSPGRAKDRCTGPVAPMCPSIPGLLCVTSVGGVPFEYVLGKGGIARDPATGLFVVRRGTRVTQKFTAATAGALSMFLTNMTKFKMPVETILTGGSLYCRCITGTNKLSNHSYGDAIDIVGLRWRTPAGIRETIVHNYLIPAERAILRRFNACLRLSFATVIDYHDRHHRDHFHCDTNLGKGKVSKGGLTAIFIKEALNKALGLAPGSTIPETPVYDSAAEAGLMRFAAVSKTDLANPATFDRVVNDLFTRVAAIP